MTDRAPLNDLSVVLRRAAREVRALTAIVEVVRGDRHDNGGHETTALHGACMAAKAVHALLRPAVDAVETAAGTDTLLSASTGGSQSTEPSALRPDLTPAERRVALLVAKGMTNPEIARQLCISPRTVQCHVSQILRKLALRRRVDIAVAVMTNDEPLS